MDEHEKRAHKTKATDHLSEKHLKNAFKKRSFNLESLSDAEQDELGFVADDEYNERDFL